MTFIEIKDLLKSTLARNRIKPQVEATNVLGEFKKIVKEVWGEEIANLAEPRYVKEKILYVHCNSATVANALSLAKKKLIGEINNACQENLIDNIVFWQ